MALYTLGGDYLPSLRGAMATEAESITPSVNREKRRFAEDLTVIVPTVGRPILEKCLRSIADGSILPVCVIAVDQGDNAAVLEWVGILDAIGVEAIRLPSAERSPASARNHGIERVRTTFVAAIDDDCAVATDWLERMIALLRENPKSIITGRLEPVGNGSPPTTVTSTVPRTHTRSSVRIHSPLASANMGFALRTARRIGPFDERLFAAEENDWAYRALGLGIPIIFTPDLIVYHFNWRTEAQLRATYRKYGWSQGAYYGKHLRHGDWSMAVRTAISLWRGLRGLGYGITRNDVDMRANAVGRLEHMLPGLVAGLRGFPARGTKEIHRGT